MNPILCHIFSTTRIAVEFAYVYMVVPTVNDMDKRTQKYFRLFLMRFRKNYLYFLKSYRGNNIRLYMNRFVLDQIKLAQTLFGDMAALQTKEYADKLSAID